jgi:hypothetical protein
MAFDVFISYASEDAAVAKRLEEELKKLNAKVWFDQSEVKIGDNLREVIDRGLRDSRYAIVILSHSYFARGWPKLELEGLISRETAGRKVILPVRHDISIDDIREYSPMLAGKASGSTATGLNALAAALASSMSLPTIAVEPRPPEKTSVVTVILRVVGAVLVLALFLGAFFGTLLGWAKQSGLVFSIGISCGVILFITREFWQRNRG